MADPHGFLRYRRVDEPERPIADRIDDWRDVHADLPSPAREKQVATQAARCMDCGIPFCNSPSSGCPLGNLIPEWNELVRNGQWRQASERLHATNNFPEFTGKLCPAPCEGGCVLAISDPAVAIKRIEATIAEVGWENGHVEVVPARTATGFHVAVVGSGPAGLAAAQQLTRAGHDVTVYERDDRIGGLMRYGIPEYKMEKRGLDRRLEQLRSEGTRFVTDCEVGRDLPVQRLRAEHDAVVLAVGALRARDDEELPGRHLEGVHQAMDHLVAANRECAGDGRTTISASGRHVVIIGGGDTGADCYGTSTRQGALNVTQLDQYPQPPLTRDSDLTPWPVRPYVLLTYPAHEEGGSRQFGVAVREFVDDGRGRVAAVRVQPVRVSRERGRRRVVPTSSEQYRWPCDLALLAIGFEGVEHMPLLDDLGIRLTPGGTIGCDDAWQTEAPGVYVCGDAHRGASLIVWAIAEGRAVARAVDERLTGSRELPAPVRPTSLPLAAV